MGHKPEMGAIQPVRLYGEGDQSVTVTPEGKLSVDAQVTAEVADSKIKGSTDAGTTWVPVRVNSSGQLEVALTGSDMQPGDSVPVSVVSGRVIRLAEITRSTSPWGGYYGATGRMGGAASSITFASSIDRSRVRRVTLFVINGLDGEIIVTPVSVFDDAANNGYLHATEEQLTIPAGARAMLAPTSESVLDIPMQRLAIRVQGGGSDITEGTLRIIVEGVV